MQEMRAFQPVRSRRSRNYRNIGTTSAGKVNLPVVRQCTGLHDARSEKRRGAEAVTAAAVIHELEMYRHAHAEPNLRRVKLEAGQMDDDRRRGWLRPRRRRAGEGKECTQGHVSQMCHRVPLPPRCPCTCRVYRRQQYQCAAGNIKLAAIGALLSRHSPDFSAQIRSIRAR
jgi:hypothetical protein